MFWIDKLTMFINTTKVSLRHKEKALIMYKAEVVKRELLIKMQDQVKIPLKIIIYPKTTSSFPCTKILI